MKNILTILFLICTLASIGQSKDWKEYRKNIKEHQKIADTTHFPTPFEFTFIDSTQFSKDELFSKANLWIATTIKNMNLDVAKDSTQGKIVIPNIQSAYSSSYEYDLVIDVRNGKYRFAFNDYKAKGMYETFIAISAAESEKRMYIGTSKKSFWNLEKLYLKEEAENIFDNFKAYIQAKDDF